MVDPRRVAIFCEDRHHEAFVTAMVRRVAREEALIVSATTISGRGGHARALSELHAFQRAWKAFRAPAPAPDLLIVVIDANCAGWAQARAACGAQVQAGLFPHVVLACPDPHIERWYMADSEGFRQVVGVPAPTDPGTCEPDLYKQLLGQALATAGQYVATGPDELAPDLVEAMHLERAGRAQASLGAFLADLRAALRRMVGGA